MPLKSRIGLHPRKRAARVVAALLFASYCPIACSHRHEASDASGPALLFDDDEPGARRDDAHPFLIPLDAPVWKAANDAQHMRPDDPIVGYWNGSQAWAIPWWILKNHHVANLELGGQPVVIALCEKCSSASACDPVVDGRRLHFRVCGFYDGTICTSDDETHTTWSPFLGVGIAGRYAKRELRTLRVDQATWADWLELHPGTVVAYGEPSERAGHGSKDSPGSKGIPAQMRKTIRHFDARLGENDLVLGVVAGGEARAYPIALLDREGTAVNDVLGGRSIVVLHKPGTWLAGAFLRRVGERDFEFAPDGNGAPVDRQTSSRWNPAGEAVEGELRGRRLEPVRYDLEEWYVWAAQHPAGSLHGAAR